MVDLKNYIKWNKDNVFGTLISLINFWEEDRSASECEWAFDLYNIDDFALFAKAYSLDTAINCYHTSQYWMGGCNFTDKESEVNGCTHLIHSLNLDDSKEFNDTLDWIMGEIEDRMEELHNKWDWGYEDITKCYGNLIDFKAYALDSLQERYYQTPYCDEKNHIFNEVIEIAKGNVKI